MPTTLERTTFTLTPPVKRMIETASSQWPEISGSRNLMLRLMAEGEAAIRQRRLEQAYSDAYSAWDSSDDSDDWEQTTADGLEENR
ncbi:MAG: hypothetical protein LBV30_05850 [Propionibacteriaceae bacterium]|jgi:hypothetical protein|nr:hypothetical protein [Propionibacteriaceae bacterium]